MKKILISLLFSVVYLVSHAQILNHQLSNPRIAFDGTNNDMLFDISVNANTGGTWLYNSTITLDVPVVFNKTVSPVFTKGFIAGVVGATQKYNATASWLGGNRMEIVVTTNFPGATPVSNYSAVQTSWQVLGTVRIRISTVNATAGITFKTSQCTGSHTNGTSFNVAYTLAFGVSDFSLLHLNRMYAGASGWTQAGVLSGADWSADVNTSVFDTVSGPACLTAANAKMASLTIHPGARLRICAGKDLTCSGPVEINAPKGLIIGSDTGSAQFINNSTITYGTGASAQVYTKLAQDQWHYYSIPVLTTNARPFSMIYMKYYQESLDKWKYVWNDGWYPTDTTLNTAMQGYAMWAASSGPYIQPGYVSPSGTLFTGTVTSYPLTRTSIPTWTPVDFNGWNLVGNPFTSAIDLGNAGINWGTLDAGKAWFWDGVAGNYKVYPSEPGYGTHSQYVPPQQAFFVHNSNTVSTALQIPSAARVINSETYLKSYSVTDLLKLKVTSSLNSFEDEVALFLREGSTPGYDEATDALKLWGNYNAPQLFSESGPVSLSVNATEWTDRSIIFPVGFWCGLPGEYTISASGIESFGTKHLYLLDKVTGKSQELNQNPVYQFVYTEGDEVGRFEVHILKNAVGTHEMDDKGMRIYTHGDNLYVTGNSGKVILCDMTGRIIYEHSLVNDGLNRMTPGVMQGVYVVIVDGPEGTLSKTVIF